MVHLGRFTAVQGDRKLQRMRNPLGPVDEKLRSGWRADVACRLGEECEPLGKMPACDAGQLRVGGDRLAFVSAGHQGNR